MNAEEILTRAQALGLSVSADRGDLVLRYEDELPADFLEELRRHKPEILALLVSEFDDDPVACRGCAAVIPAGTTLCVDCGKARSPLVRLAVQMCEMAKERTLRGGALVALDRCGYPRLRLPDGQTVNAGLIAWCPVLREASPETLEWVIGQLEGRARR